MDNTTDRTSKYRAGSLSLIGAVALGTGVMIGAGIFALTGQMAEMTGSLFPLAFLSAALIVSFSAYSYVKLSNAYPSAGGIGMYLEKAYGRPLTTAFLPEKESELRDAGLAVIGVLKDFLAPADVMVDCTPQGIASFYCMEKSRRHRQG